MLRRRGWMLVVAWVASFSLAATTEPAKIGDPTFVGNYFAFFNPSSGAGGTQMLTIDVDEYGNYIAFQQDGQGPTVSAKLEAAGGRWKLIDADGKTMDEGTYTLMGPQIHVAGSKGIGYWSKVAPQSRQATLTKLKINPKAADVAPFVAEAIRKARADWKKDAVLVEIQTVPNDDGSFDLTPPGGNLTLRFYSKSANQGCWGRVDNWGDIALQPEQQPISSSRWGIPTNIVELKSAYAKAKEIAGNVKIVEAMLWGAGNDPDLRQFCWIFRTENGVIAVDALLGNVTSYDEFRDGRERARAVPFDVNTGSVYWMTSTGGTAGTRLMWFRKHPVFLDGIDEAIIIRVPVQVVTKAEMLQHATKDPDGGITYRGDRELYPLSGFRPMDAEQIEQFLMDKDAIAIDCAPRAVETVEPLSKYPPGTKERIKKQLESYWRAHGGR